MQLFSCFRITCVCQGKCAKANVSVLASLQIVVSHFAELCMFSSGWLGTDLFYNLLGPMFAIHVVGCYLLLTCV